MPYLKRSSLNALALLSFVLLVGCGQADAVDAPVSPPPKPLVDVAPGTPGELQTAVFAGGCFWGVQAVFQHVKGVRSAVSGYAGGTRKDPSYDAVSSGSTGHAESVEVKFDPAQVSYGTLLTVFFSVAHDPTQLNRQGPDVGTQYRSIAFYANDSQKKIATAYIQQLSIAKAFARPIVTALGLNTRSAVGSPFAAKTWAAW